MSFIHQLASKRRKFLDGLDANEGDINLDIFEDFYPDQAHFIYELLQNAEDARATRATFTLKHDGCSFEHDGKRSFTEDDVRAITGIHNSNKSKRPDQIGQFGVGFKSVFVYTLTPEVRSGKFAFKITRLVMPECIDDAPNAGNRTRFDLPFNSPKKSAQEAYAEIEAGLNSLAETTLLFLSNLKSIRWQIGESISGEVERIQYPKNHFEVRKKINGEATARSHFIHFDEPVEGLVKKRVAVAFALDFLPKVESFNPKKSLAEQMKIVPANPGRVAVFFPAEKETSGLRFHLHAPFVPELSRASIKETPANNPLFQQLAKLTAASLHKIRDLGLLNAGFLEVLPNPRDDLRKRYEGIDEAIIEEMNNQPLTPTHTGMHAAANRLRQARASLKELLSEADIEFLVGYDKEEEEPPLWAIGVTQKNSRIDHFLTGLEIRSWDIEQFVQLLDAHTMEGLLQTPNAQFSEWLKNKPLEWHQQLYALLSDHLASDRYSSLERIKSFQIVRLSDGSYCIGRKCFFRSDGIEHDEEMPRVAESVYTSGENERQKKAARKFLEDVGVREVGEAEQVEAILQRRYRSDCFRPSKQDLKRFIALVEKEPQKTKLFAEYFIFEGKDGKWRQPSQVFLDTPFLDTGLSAYYQALGDGAQKMALSDSYRDDSTLVERLQNFALAVGVQKALRVTQSFCRSNPCWTELSSGDKFKRNNDSYDRVDCDFEIAEFQKLISLQTVAASRLIWLTMMKVVRPEQLTARYQRNNYSEPRERPSQLVHRLINAAWVPQGAGRFVRPAEASRVLLPNDFEFAASWKWVEAIRFGEEVQQKSEEQREKQVAAKLLEIAEDSIQDAQWFAALTRDERQRFRQDHERQQSQELPEHESANPDRRAERVRQQAAEAPERITEERVRSVSVGREKLKQEAAQYLRQQYTNPDGEMICQVCKTSLPFKLDDGSFYVEKIPFLTDLKKSHYQNYLALCPNHAAMYELANGSEDSLRLTFSGLKRDKLGVVLCSKK